MTLGMGTPHRSNPFPLPSRDPAGSRGLGTGVPFRWQYLSGRLISLCHEVACRVCPGLFHGRCGEPRQRWSSPTSRLCL